MKHDRRRRDERIDRLDAYLGGPIATPAAARPCITGVTPCPRSRPPSRSRSSATTSRAASSRPMTPTTTHARTVMLGGIDRRPGVIVRVADADDVVRVISLARETGVPLAVRSGGHSAAAHSVIDDGIVLDLRDMHAIEIDVEGRTAWAETGAHGGRVHDRRGGARARGRVRRHRLGRPRRDHARRRDRVPGADVRPDHRLAAGGRDRDRRRPAASASTPTRTSDLFWAIRGGGGNFGVATRFQYRLHPVGQVVGRHAGPAGDRRHRGRVHRGGRGGARGARRRSRTSCRARRCRSSPRSTTASS